MLGFRLAAVRRLLLGLDAGMTRQPLLPSTSHQRQR
jgi:hypothetical protein